MSRISIADLIGQLRADLVDAEVAVARYRGAIDALEPLLPDAPAKTERKTPPPNPRSECRCDPCGISFPNPQGLGAHRRHKHPAPSPARTGRTEPAVTGDVAGRYQCSTPGCGYETSLRSELAEHTRSAHDRNLLLPEQRSAMSA